MERENILSRIVKLLALAGDNPNEHEAANAAVQARKLMQKFDIEEREVEGHEDSSNREMNEEVPTTKKDYSKWEIDLAYSMKFFLPVDMFVRSSWLCKKPVFVGHRADVEVVICMYDYIRKTISRLGRKYKQSNKEIPGADRSFCVGAVATVRSRLVARHREEEEKAHEDKKSDEAKYALICVDKKKEIDEWIKKTYPSMRTTNSRSSSASSAAYLAGREAGKSISLNHQIGSS